MLYDQYDGGGLLAIAFRGKRIVSAGRDGGAKSWLLTRPVEGRPLELVPQTEIVSDSLWASLVLQSDETTLWAGHLDGTLSKWALDGAPPTASVRVKTSAAVLAVAVDEERGVVAAGTADGGVARARIADGQQASGEWRPLAFDGSKGYKGAKTMSVAFARERERESPASPAGSAARCTTASSRPTAPPASTRTARRGRCCPHTADRSSTSRLPATASSSARRTTARCASGISRSPPTATARPRCATGLGGYKVWLGSVCVDDKRLISDGSDNTVVVHDFSKSD